MAFFNPNWFLNSSKSHPRNISSSLNPIPTISNIAFIVISEDIFPNQNPHLVPIIGITIRDIKIVDTKNGNLKNVDIIVEEKATGEILVGAGVGSEGGTAQFSVSENNFLPIFINLFAFIVYIFELYFQDSLLFCLSLLL